MNDVEWDEEASLAMSPPREPVQRLKVVTRLCDFLTLAPLNGSPPELLPLTVFGAHVFLSPQCSQANSSHDAYAIASLRTALSTSRAPEEVAQASDSGPRWFQLYWSSSDDVALSLLSRIKKLRFFALVVTLNSVRLGWRCLDTAYLPASHGLGTQVGLSDPVFMVCQGLQPCFDHPTFPLDPDALDKLRMYKGDKFRIIQDLGLHFISAGTLGWAGRAQKYADGEIDPVHVFGSGRRSSACPGIILAKAALYINIVSILMVFEIKAETEIGSKPSAFTGGKRDADPVASRID
ncbi:hypothetical protein EW146_g4247 [Bondarzewia mesenterica]|uniref:FMN-dependent dehydrogenase domain-containing protein n=1 Tax=Bondarzewia mesenterica TaxID=1095465 RepID=A0A4S4LWZ9_9AGAM|nr:hypothetical protein EW146_g4247 [Bondarzewia mesenterica]